MFDLLYLRLGFCYLLSCALWPLAMLGYWSYRVLGRDEPRLHNIDFVVFGGHLIALLGWLTFAAVFIFPLLRAST